MMLNNPNEPESPRSPGGYKPWLRDKRVVGRSTNGKPGGPLSGEPASPRSPGSYKPWKHAAPVASRSRERSRVVGRETSSARRTPPVHRHCFDQTSGEEAPLIVLTNSGYEEDLDDTTSLSPNSGDENRLRALWKSHLSSASQSMHMNTGR